MPATEKLSITLPAEMVTAIRASVAKGTHANASAVMRQAMREWLDREREFAELEAALDEGVAGLDAGLGLTTEEVRRRLLGDPSP